MPSAGPAPESAATPELPAGGQTPAQQPVEKTDAQWREELTSEEYRVLRQAGTERHLVVDLLENLSLLEIAKAFRELTAHSDPAVERAEAADTLAASLAALAGLGGGVSGEVVEGKAVDGLVAKVKELSAGQAVVITRPHAVADTFHTDWATKAQDKLGLPVLHLYAGSGFIGDS